MVIKLRIPQRIVAESATSPSFAVDEGAPDGGPSRRFPVQILIVRHRGVGRCPSPVSHRLPVCSASEGGAIHSTIMETGELHTVALLPWCTVEEPLSIDGVRIFPFERRGANSGVSNQDAEHIGRLMGLFRSGEDPIRSASVLHLEHKSIADPLAKDEMEQIFDAANALALAGLFGRRFFEDQSYCNTESFKCIVQNFNVRSNFIALTARRKDRGYVNIVPLSWSREGCPPHCVQLKSFNTDVELIHAIRKAFRHPKRGPAYRDAAFFFLHANTDAPNMPIEHECLGMVSALQRILDAGFKEDRLVQAVARRLEKFDLHSPEEYDLKSTLTAQGKGGEPLHIFWLRRLYWTRSSFGHGDRQSKKPWSPDAHLLLAAYFLPLMFKICLRDDGLRELTDDDLEALYAFPSLVGLKDPFAEDTHGLYRSIWLKTVHGASIRRSVEKSVKNAQ